MYSALSCAAERDHAMQLSKVVLSGWQIPQRKCHAVANKAAAAACSRSSNYPLYSSCPMPTHMLLPDAMHILLPNATKRDKIRLTQPVTLHCCTQQSAPVMRADRLSLQHKSPEQTNLNRQRDMCSSSSLHKCLHTHAPNPCSQMILSLCTF